MLGLDIIISEKTRKEIKADAYDKALHIAWEAMEKGGVHDIKGDLHLVLLAGKESEIKSIDYKNVKVDKGK